MVAKKVRNVGTIVVRGRERKLYEGSKGGIFYRSKGAKVYVDKKVLRKSSQKKKKVITKKKNKFGGGYTYRGKRGTTYVIPPLQNAGKQMMAPGKLETRITPSRPRRHNFVEKASSKLSNFLQPIVFRPKTIHPHNKPLHAYL